MRSPLAAYLVSVVVLAAVAWPAFRDPPRDSFPLSNYPMFSRARPDPIITLTNVTAVHADGGRTPLTPGQATGNDEVLQAMVLIRGAARSPAPRRQAFCETAARRLVEGGDAEGVVAVEIATVRHDSLAYFRDGYEPLARRVHHRCEVAR